jgi:hypothetical protein
MQRMFTALERRKAREMLRRDQTILDLQWRRQYETWWHDGGWSIGAPDVERAYDAMIRGRTTPPQAG